MDAGGLAQMSPNNFAPNGLAMPSGGLAARRGGQPKPLAVELINQNKEQDPAPTPRTSRSHLLAGLRTAPKSATVGSFSLQSPTTGPMQQHARNSMAGNAYNMGQDNAYNAPKTAYPQYAAQNNYNSAASQQYTVEQVLAPPELSMDEQNQEGMDPNLYAQLLATNMYLAQQQQRLQQQLRSVQAATQQFSNMNLNNPQLTQHQMNLNSPPKRYESPTEVAPLPPPSANAFRRGHKKASSLAPVNSVLATSFSSDAPKSAGPKTSTFPITPLTGGYGPGQARAGEHPVRQPRGPPSLDELKAKPTAKHEGSKNFSARTRRSAVHNLVRAGLERRKGTGSSCGSMSPVSETAEESSSPITDDESDSGRSGSGSLAGDLECPSSRTSASGGWGAIGSDRPSSRQKARKSVDSMDSITSNAESENSSFANVFKNGALRAAKAQDSADNQRKAPRLVLTKNTSTA
ncbi:hypothetical protein KAF25_007069 [Fusarium avenaceum]|uniref:Uncharacterized protein n=1 Tax=Fusarium avenaceum TaxID=40199 RepID=A0A9P7GXL6_9HYPO|nr:hypothetical protein KAF25_007069 [Fusarium avenaceum]